MKKLKKITRNELKKIDGGILNPGGGGGIGGYNCENTCSAGDGFCEQYGLTCGVWFYTSPDGTLAYMCTKCA